ncbi:MAG: type I restriction enzyme HsdR N-terminal domain-containing protein [Phycisphaerae bacterium]|nr:type I restriction enzyme HsdR N-terminal domain-containing protein [Phycisphaerae bacterium]
MPNIPKKVLERFVKTVPRFQKVLQIAKDRDVNEADTVAVLNDVFGEVFGYHKYLEVTSEVAIRGTYCDLAVKVEDKLQFLIEVKAIGIDLKDAHMKQACDYGANHGVPWVVLTNGIQWRLYRIRFEQPIGFDLVCQFSFLDLNARQPKDQEYLFLLAREGLAKNVRDDFYERTQSVNRYIIGNLIIAEPVLTLLRRELKKLAGAVKIDVAEVERIVKAEVLKREVMEGEASELARARVTRFYRKGARALQKTDRRARAIPPDPAESITDRLLREAHEESAGQSG